MGKRSTLRRAFRILGPCVPLALAGCGNYDGGGGSGGTIASASQGGATNPAAGGGGIDPTANRAAFQTTVYPLLRDYCVACHAGAGPGFPHIAHPDLPTAYAAVYGTQKVNLLAPENSRLVRRLDPEAHHCWSNCADDAETMRAAIAAWATAVEAGSGGTAVEGIASRTALFSDGSEDPGELRYDETVIALYEFKEGDGPVALDTSGVEPPMDLELIGDVEWLSSYGIEIAEGRAEATREDSRKLYDRIANPGTGTQQFTVEAWVVPANTTQEGPARIVTYSQGTNRRNFLLGQTLYNYVFRNRSMAPEVDENGEPALVTYDGDQDLQATQQHVALTFDQYRGRRIYVNGRFTDDEDPQGPGRLWTWDPGFRLVLGNETSNNRLWQGRIQLVAIHERALTDAQILQNYSAGVGKRVLLGFDLSPWLGAGGAVEFTVSEFDEGSYLFCEPTIVSPGGGTVRVGGIRIAVNGQVPVAGQAFVNVDELVSGPRQTLSRQCSIIAKDLGSDLDSFHVEFEYLGGFEDPDEPLPPPPLPPIAEFGEALPELGIRNFDRINDTMSALTGVDPLAPGVRDTFEELEQQLPATVDLRSFTTSQQVGIAKLALEYCDGLVESPGLRASFFPGVDFGAPATTAFQSGSRELVTQPLVARMIGSNVASQPNASEVEAVLLDLVGELTQGCDAATCGAERTRTVVKAACAAVLSSAAVTIH